MGNDLCWIKTKASMCARDEMSIQVNYSYQRVHIMVVLTIIGSVFMQFLIVDIQCWDDDLFTA